MDSRAACLTGELTRWDDDRGFGFISPLDGRPDVFLHISAFPRSGGRPRLGDLMSFALERRDDGRFRAAQVELIRTAATASRSPARPVARRGHLLPRGAGTAAALLVVVAFGASLALIGSRWPVPAWAAALYAALSIVCFLVYAADKSAAVAGRWRISENTLLALGLLGGWPGALLAQQVLRHKLRKRRFMIVFAGTVAVNVGTLVVLVSPSGPPMLSALLNAFF